MIEEWTKGTQQKTLPHPPSCTPSRTPLLTHTRIPGAQHKRNPSHSSKHRGRSMKENALSTPLHLLLPLPYARARPSIGLRQPQTPRHLHVARAAKPNSCAAGRYRGKLPLWRRSVSAGSSSVGEVSSCLAEAKTSCTTTRARPASCRNATGAELTRGRTLSRCLHSGCMGPVVPYL